MKSVLRSLSILLLFFSFTESISAQSSEIIGQVLDDESNPLANATVAIYEPGNDQIISGTATQVSGEFTLEAEPGTYTLKITFLSFQEYEQEIVVEDGETLDLETIQLEPSQSELGEVEVEGQRSYMEMNFDSRSFNVEDDITSLGGSALDVLDNVPSITTDFEGNVSLRGNQGVQILINGRPSNLVRGGTDALSSIPAGMIEEVKIITNPSARYAANGTGGIIDIILVDDAELGLNGTVRANTGYPQDHSVGFNLNYQKNIINWFVNAEVEYERDPRSSSTFQSFSSTDTTFAYQENSDWFDREQEGNVNFGADIFLSESELMTIDARINFETAKEDRDVNYIDFDPTNDEIYEAISNDWATLRESVREANEEQNESDFDIRMLYEKTFDEEGDHVLATDLDFEFGNEDETANLDEQINSGPGENLRERTNGGEIYREARFDLDYERPVGENGRLEAGGRFNYDWQDSDYLVERFENGVWVEAADEVGAADNFKYSENVNSLYATFSGELKPFTYQLGLRAENTRITTELDQQNLGSEQNYTNLFPSIFLSYSLNEQNSFQVSYSRRISRPRSWYLLPFTDISDNRYRSTGNPDLEPEFGDSYELGYLRYWETGSVLTSFYYRDRTQVIDRVSVTGNDGITTRTPINLSNENAWGVEFSADQDLFENLQLSGSLNLYQSETKGEFEGISYDSKSENLTSRLRVRWGFAETWNFQSYLYFRGASETAQGRRPSRSFVGSGLSKELLDGRANISINVRDVFNSRNGDREIIEPNSYTNREFSWSSRSFRVNFRYNFGGNNDSRGR
ncbi:MAG: outer membrane beta-barrel family protein [Gracilimonas sp.]